jgi:hypothetical protein
VVLLLACKAQPVQDVRVGTLNLVAGRGEKQVAIAPVFRWESSRREENGDRSATHVGMTPTVVVPPPRFMPDKVNFIGC